MFKSLLASKVLNIGKSQSNNKYNYRPHNCK